MATQKYFDHGCEAWCSKILGGGIDFPWICTRPPGHGDDCETVDPVTNPVRVARAGFKTALPLDPSPQFSLEKWKAGACGYCGNQRGNLALCCNACTGLRSADELIAARSVTRDFEDEYHIAAQNRIGATTTTFIVDGTGKVKRKAELIVRVDGIERVKAVLDAADSFYRYACTLGPLVVKEMPSEERRFRDELAKMGAALRPEAFRREVK